MRRIRSRVLSATVIGTLLSFGVAGDPAVPQSAENVHTHQVVINDFTFEPSTLTVPAGTVVAWVNKDDDPHTVIGTDPGSPIKSRPLDTGDRYSITLTKPGTYRYFCSLHPHMTGMVIVQ